MTDDGLHQRGWRAPQLTPEEIAAIAAIESEQQRRIDNYLSDLWCPVRPSVLPPSQRSRNPVGGIHNATWVRRLDLARLRTLPYADVLEAVRAA